MSVSVEQTISSKLQPLEPEHLEIANESHMHSGPATDSHFKLTVVSDQFDGKRPVARHQLVYGLLADELAGPVHALALHLYTPQEWQQSGQAPDSPNCRGGSKGG
ncbi:BolA family protein [Bacterioplanoides sp.]|uniref:BolA family protein n=1 Tax=Bacterioplanoides sp. TaxID=2066072 RepID=UPI003B5B7FB9